MICDINRNVQGGLNEDMHRGMNEDMHRGMNGDINKYMHRQHHDMFMGCGKLNLNQTKDYIQTNMDMHMR
eukprot:9269778-Ditylum_brightwellii.AAC.1